jgi:hypothetical protein
LQAPIYDVPTAAEVLETGSYPLLPALISDLRPPPPPKPSGRADALRLMDQHIRTQLLQAGPCEKSAHRCCAWIGRPGN